MLPALPAPRPAAQSDTQPVTESKQTDHPPLPLRRPTLPSTQKTPPPPPAMGNPPKKEPGDGFSEFYY